MNPPATQSVAFKLLQHPRKSRISLTPLIDVVFILLLFFMLSSSFIQWRAVDLQPASHDTASIAMDPDKILYARLTATGELYLFERLWSMAEDAALAVKINQYAHNLIILTPHDENSLQDIIKHSERLAYLGASQVALDMNPSP